MYSDYLKYYDKIIIVIGSSKDSIRITINIRNTTINIIISIFSIIISVISEDRVIIKVFLTIPPLPLQLGTED